MAAVYEHENGLMEQIEALTAPPTFNGKTSGGGGEYRKGKGRQQQQHCQQQPLQRWKSVNSQYCDACGEGGELLCCDRCPASFHLLCHDPPIDAARIPQGKWMCNRCRNCPDLIDPQTLLVLPTIPANGLQNTFNGRHKYSNTNATPTTVPVQTCSSEHRVLAHLTEAERNAAVMRAVLDKAATRKGVSALALLAEAASAVNSSEFELPDDIRRPVELPGDDAVSWRNKAEKWRRLPHEKDSNGLVPRKPTKLCFTCSRSCLDSLLVQCDFCPLTFHLDCLDPPLAAAPKERWMCPNHVEHILDRKMLRSLSLTERMTLWRKHAKQPIDELSVKLTFLRDAHNVEANGNERLTWCPPKLKRLKVPAAIRDLYRKRWTDPKIEYSRQLTATPEEQSQWLSTLLDMQRYQVMSDILGQCISTEEEKPCTSRSIDCHISKKAVLRSHRSTSEAPTETTSITERFRKRRSSAIQLSGDVAKRPKTEVNGEQRIKRLQETLLKRISDARCTSDDDDDSELICVLALQRLQQLTPSPPSLSSTGGESRLCLDPKKTLRTAPVLAVLKLPVSSPVPIQNLVSTMGVSPSCSIDLSRETSCLLIDAHHASIVFDKVRRRFELLVYGRGGVEVDGVLYGWKEEEGRERCACSDGGALRGVRGWDGAAPLRHGSVLRIGCVRLLFASLF